MTRYVVDKLLLFEYSRVFQPPVRLVSEILLVLLLIITIWIKNNKNYDIVLLVFYSEKLSTHLKK